MPATMPTGTLTQNTSDQLRRATMTAPTSAKPPSRPTMVGIAVATIVLSIAAMNIVAMVAANTHGRLDACVATARGESTEDGPNKAAPMASGQRATLAQVAGFGQCQR